MSYLPQAEAGFYEAIQVFFTELTGRAALFGARDQVLLRAWKEEGRSAQIVCRGIREAVINFGEEKQVRSLGDCEAFIDEQWERAREQQVGAHRENGEDIRESGEEVTPKSKGKTPAGSLFEEASQAIERAGKGTEQERWREAYRAAWRAMKKIREERGGFSFEEIEAVDRALVDAYQEALNEDERRLIESELASVSAGLAQGMSPAARRDHLFIRRKRALIQEFGLLDLMEALAT